MCVFELCATPYGHDFHPLHIPRGRLFVGSPLLSVLGANTGDMLQRLQRSPERGTDHAALALANWRRMCARDNPLWHDANSSGGLSAASAVGLSFKSFGRLVYVSLGASLVFFSRSAAVSYVGDEFE